MRGFFRFRRHVFLSGLLVLQTINGCGDSEPANPNNSNLPHEFPNTASSINAEESQLWTQLVQYSDSGTVVIQDVPVKVWQDQVVFDHDIILGNVRDFKLSSTKTPQADLKLLGYTIDPLDPEVRGRLWPLGVVPYTISPEFSAATRTNIANAISDYRNKTLIRFVPRTNETNYVEFTLSNMPAAGASLGMQIGRQEIKIHHNEGVGTIIHEMGHTVGLYHEHQNPEMQKWVKFVGNMAVEWDKFCYDYFFGEFVSGGRSKYNRYDTKSIMGYAHGCFLNQNAPLRVSTSYSSSAEERKVLHKNVLSPGDVRTINGLYQDKTPGSFPPEQKICKDEVDPLFCQDFRAKGDCHNYYMAIAAYDSCRKTCDLCKYTEAFNPAAF